MYRMQRVELHEARTSTEAASWAFLFGVQYTCPRSISPPTTALRFHSFLADLLGGAALWAVSADTGKRVLSPQRHFPAGSAVCDLEIALLAM